MVKAIALFSGGLDSILAIKLVQTQNIEVIAVSFTSPFFISEEKQNKMQEVAKQNNFKLIFLELKDDYIKIVKKPKHGYGKNMNPCIDCHTFMLKKANQYAKEIDAKFIFTGEVLNERPMSQNHRALKIVEEESGLKGKLLRPLSAKLLEETKAEKKGYIDRNKLLAINGRSRKPQIELAKQFNLTEYEHPAGGCLLTNIEYSQRLKELLKHKKTLSLTDFSLLKYGRHFWEKDSRIIVGRHQADNEAILKLASDKDYIFTLKDIPGPTTLLQGKKSKEAIKQAATLTKQYSKVKDKEVEVIYKGKSLIL
jgi:tRNA U34 2-thiouridine synthase MnmA/TrmU